MFQDDPDLDQRLSRFEAQLDRFSLALHQWQQTQPPHEHAPSADGDRRLRTLEEVIDREALALRRMHEEPLKELQAQAAILRELCAAAASSVNNLDQAESRLAAIQADVHQLLTELSRSLQSVVAELRAGASTALAPQTPAAAWPLDHVVNLHEELRRGATTDQPARPALISDATPSASAVTRELLHESESGDDAPRFGRRSWYVGGALVAAAAFVFFILERRIETRLDDASARVEAAQRETAAATRLANQQVLAARQEANKQIVEARQSAQRAEVVGAILTAPDLIRFSLFSGNVERSSAQLLLSRTRGLVLSASRLPAAPPETIYQLWLKTNTVPVSAGVFVPDATGRATLVTDVPPKIIGPVLGAEVTVEPNGGRTAPSGRTLLVPLPQG